MAFAAATGVMPLDMPESVDPLQDRCTWYHVARSCKRDSRYSTPKRPFVGKEGALNCFSGPYTRNRGSST